MRERRKMDSKNKIANCESKNKMNIMIEYSFSHFLNEIAVIDDEKNNLCRNKKYDYCITNYYSKGKSSQ